MIVAYFKKNNHKLAALIVTGEAVIGQVLRLASNLLLTRLLVPEMFGVMMIAMLFLTGITMLSDLGLKEKFIQSERAYKKDFLDTCWSLQVIRGIIIFTVVLIISYFLHLLSVQGYIVEGSAYSAPELPVVVAVIGITAVLNGFNSIGLYDHYRNVRMYILAKIGLISNFTGTIVMVIVAYYYREFWVLLISPLLSATLQLYLSYLYSNDIKANFRLKKRDLKDIVNFSKWIFIGSCLSYFSMNADRIILGGYLSTGELGIFSIAFMLVLAAKEMFFKVIKNVAYPKLTRVVRNNPDHLKGAMYSLRLKIDVLTFSIAGFLFGAGSIIISILYDSRYSDAGWMLEILAISIVFSGLNVNQQALLALSKTFLFALVHTCGAIYAFVAIPAIYLLIGVEGVMYVMALKAISTIPVLFYLQIRYGVFDLIKEFRAFPLFILFYLIGIYAKTIFYSYWVY